MSGRICKHEGCGRPARGRGMCNAHYMAWRRANPEVLTVGQLSEKLVLEALPGTMPQVAERTGLHRETVSSVLKALNKWEGRQVRIYDYLPPTAYGRHWTPLWQQGGGVNYKLTAERKTAHAKAVKLRTRPEYRKKLEMGMVAPAPRASWLDALGGGA